MSTPETPAPASTGSTDIVLPAATLAYFQQPQLAPVWAAARARLERKGLAVSKNHVWVDLDEEGRSLLLGITSGTVSSQPGKGTPVRLDLLDAALRRSAANCGLLSVLTALGGPLTDRQEVRAERSRKSIDLWNHVESALLHAGLSGAPWAPAWLTGVRRSGILTRAGRGAATAATEACAVLAVLAEDLPLSGSADDLTSMLPAARRFELGELASRCTSSAHGLDTGTTTGALVLRAVAVATGQAPPANAASWRLMWDSVGVSPDHVSGTVLLWAVRPPGTGPWSQMMTARADLGLVTHVTMQEWRQAAAAERWAVAGQVVHVCENPQVLQAAARARIETPLLCLSGNPATVGVAVIDALVAAGADVRYHGDFDVEGMKIAQRVLARGATAWRLSAQDYQHALTVSSSGEQLALNGVVAATPWDPDLAADMNRAGISVHEEALLEFLTVDLRQAAVSRL